MDRPELIAEIKRINKLLGGAAKRAAAQNVLIDKLTAAHLRVQTLLQKLKEAQLPAKARGGGRLPTHLEGQHYERDGVVGAPGS
jgi:hypothetical protein